MQVIWAHDLNLNVNEYCMKNRPAFHVWFTKIKRKVSRSPRVASNKCARPASECMQVKRQENIKTFYVNNIKLLYSFGVCEYRFVLFGVCRIYALLVCCARIYYTLWRFFFFYGFDLQFIDGVLCVIYVPYLKATILCLKVQNSPRWFREHSI